MASGKSHLWTDNRGWQFDCLNLMASLPCCSSCRVESSCYLHSMFAGMVRSLPASVTSAREPAVRPSGCSASCRMILSHLLHQYETTLPLRQTDEQWPRPSSHATLCKGNQTGRLSLLFLFSQGQGRFKNVTFCAWSSPGPCQRFSCRSCVEACLECQQSQGGAARKEQGHPSGDCKFKEEKTDQQTRKRKTDNNTNKTRRVLALCVKVTLCETMELATCLATPCSD